MFNVDKIFGSECWTDCTLDNPSVRDWFTLMANHLSGMRYDDDLSRCVNVSGHGMMKCEDAQEKNRCTNSELAPQRRGVAVEEELKRQIRSAVEAAVNQGAAQAPTVVLQTDNIDGSDRRKTMSNDTTLYNSTYFLPARPGQGLKLTITWPTEEEINQSPCVWDFEVQVTTSVTSTPRCTTHDNDGRGKTCEPLVTSYIPAVTVATHNNEFDDVCRSKSNTVDAAIRQVIQ